MKLSFSKVEITQPVLPFSFQTACHKTVFWFYGAVSPFGARSFVPHTFNFQTPLSECRIMIGLKLFKCQCRGFESSRSDGLQKSLHHQSIDRKAANIEAVDTATVDQVLAGTVVAGPGVFATVVD